MHFWQELSAQSRGSTQLLRTGKHWGQLHCGAISQARVGLHVTHDLGEILLLEVWLVEASEVPHFGHHLVVKVCAGPVLPQFDHPPLVEVLAVHVPCMDREFELWHARVLEFVLVEELEVGAHHGQPSVLPGRLIKDNLPGACKVTLVPIGELLLHVGVGEALALAPRTVLHGHVRTRESHEEACFWHWKANLTRKDEKLEADPCADGVCPHKVGLPVCDLVVDDGKKFWRQGVNARVHRSLLQLLAPRVIKGDYLHLPRLFHPFMEGRLQSCVIGFSTARIVEAEHAELAILEGVLEDLVFGAVVVEFLFHFCVILHDLCLELLVNLYWCWLPWRTNLLLLFLGHGQLLAADFDADPALCRPSARTLDQLVVQAFADELHLFNGGASGEPILCRG
mmetsp:Transcript_9964/g.23482  ORF Transcript_9964/g.23482 Transcript_9964/m.23482 type:complete len:396 (+) Transcript_9964:34-1221(+)